MKKGQAHSAATKAKMREAKLKMWANPLHREKIVNKLRQFWDNPANRQKIIDACEYRRRSRKPPLRITASEPKESQEPQVPKAYHRCPDSSLAAAVKIAMGLTD